MIIRYVFLIVSFLCCNVYASESKQLIAAPPGYEESVASLNEQYNAFKEALRQAAEQHYASSQQVLALNSQIESVNKKWQEVKAEETKASNSNIDALPQTARAKAQQKKLAVIRGCKKSLEEQEGQLKNLDASLRRADM